MSIYVIQPVNGEDFKHMCVTTNKEVAIEFLKTCTRRIMFEYENTDSVVDTPTWVYEVLDGEIIKHKY